MKLNSFGHWTDLCGPSRLQTQKSVIWAGVQNWSPVPTSGIHPIWGSVFFAPIERNGTKREWIVILSTEIDELDPLPSIRYEKNWIRWPLAPQLCSDGVHVLKIGRRARAGLRHGWPPARDTSKIHRRAEKKINLEVYGCMKMSSEFTLSFYNDIRE